MYFSGEKVWTLKGESLQRFRRQAQFIFYDAEAALDPRQAIGNAITELLIAHGLLEKNRPKAVSASYCSKLDCASSNLIHCRGS